MKRLDEAAAVLTEEHSAAEKEIIQEVFAVLFC